MNLVWLAWAVSVLILSFFFLDQADKRRADKDPNFVQKGTRGKNLMGILQGMAIVISMMAPTLFIEFPRSSAIVSGEHLQEGVPVSFENGVVTPHPWGAWNPVWAPRVLELPAPWLNMVSFAPGQKGATYQVRNKEVGWLTISFNISVFIDDYKTFFSLPERQNVQWDDKALRARTISDFLDIVDEKKDALVRWASDLSTEEVRALGTTSEVSEISEELVRRLGPLADGLSIRTTSTVLGPFREF